MTTESTERHQHVDGALREAFAVDEELARRVSDHALAAPPHDRSGAPLAASLALAAVTLCAAAVTWLSLLPIRPATVSTVPPDGSQLSASFIDGVLTVSIPGDGVVIAGPGPRDDRPPEGSGVVLVEGDAR